MFKPGQIVESPDPLTPAREIILVGTPAEINMPAFMRACVNAKALWVSWRDRAGVVSFELAENMATWTSTGAL